MKLKLLTVLLTGILISCSPAKKEKSADTTGNTIPENTGEFAQGVVIPLVRISNDPSESFALYLPSTYHPDSFYQSMIFIDPHGDGSLPLNLYKHLAEKHNFVLIGSNSSKNGMSFEQTNQVVGRLILDTKSRFKILPDFTLCGFSGGAKVALVYASNNTTVKNVIYTGAVAGVNPHSELRLLGFAGKRDMNYCDLVSFDWSLVNPQTQHYLVEWHGKHEWPSAEVFEDAFIFVKSKKIPDYKSKKITITADAVMLEQQIKQKYFEAFRDKDLDWWNAEINNLQLQKANNLTSERVLGFISLACYSYAGQALAAKNRERAEKILAIYSWADPGNEDCRKFKEMLEEMAIGF